MYICISMIIDDYRWLSKQKTHDAENTWMQISRCHDVGFTSTVFPSQIGLEKDGSSGKQIETLSYAVVKSLNPAVKKNFPADFGQVWCGQGTVSMWWATCDKYARHWGSSSQCLRMEHKTYLKPPTSCSIVLPCYTPRFSCNKTFQWVFFTMVFRPREPLNAKSFEEIWHILFCPYSFSDQKKWFRCVFLLVMPWLVLIRSRFWPRLGGRVDVDSPTLQWENSPTDHDFSTRIDDINIH